MFVTDVLLPRAILVNAALYATVALLYTIIFFALETSSPGKYVFSDTSNLAAIFSYLVICSWPVLLFGALILIAVRVGGNVRRRRRRRRRKRSKKSKAKNNTDKPRKQPPSTVPPTAQPDHPTSTPQNSSQSLQPVSSQSLRPDSTPGNSASLTPNTSATRGKSSKSASKSRRRVEKGFVSVTRPQRIFAALGFLWVSVGLACSAAAAVIVFLGQRERYQDQAIELGIEVEVWKSWLIPIFCGILMAVVFTVLSVTTLLKVFSTFAATGREIPTPPQSENDASTADLEEEDLLFADGEPTAPPLTPAVSAAEPSRPAPVVRGRVKMVNSTYHVPPQLPYQPDQKTVDRLMRQLRDMGFPSPHQNLAALQASSFDLERAGEKLTNAQTV